MQLFDLFLAPEDLFRLGNATSPRLTHIRRPKDIDTNWWLGVESSQRNNHANGLKISK